MFQLEHPFYGLTLSPEDRVRVHEEIAILYYNSNGGISHDEAYSMPVFLRNFNIRWIVNQKQREREESERQPQKDVSAKGPPINKILPRRTPSK